MGKRTSVTTEQPILGSGWYRRTDGTIGKYQWKNGRVKCVLVVPSAEWAINDDGSKGTIH